MLRGMAANSSLRSCWVLIVIWCTCLKIDIVTSSSIPPEKDDLQKMIHELKSSVHEEISALSSELDEAKAQLAEARLYLGQSLAALSSAAIADSKQNDDVEKAHVIERRSAPESDGDILSSLSLHDLMPLLSSRCRDGRDGINGKDGKDGTGKDGLNGKDGKDGLNGKDGKDGLNGKDGKDGINGRDGIGKDGRDGLPGPQGDDGSSGNAGSPGPQGPPGLPGTRGLQGRPGNTTKGENGIPGQPGNDGEPGAKGSHGLQGVAGVAGTPGGAGTPGTPGLHGPAGLPGVRGPSGAPGLPGNASESGSVYTRWGRTTCAADTSLLYHGVAAGSHYNNAGGGANYQCLHSNPEYNNYSNGGTNSIISGAEYESYSFGLFPNAAYDQNVPCARCYTSRSAVVMIPARRSCNSGWTKEYEGYLMTSYQSQAHATTYECVDGQPEYIAGHSSNTDGALFYFVKPDCSSTGTIAQCPPYDANKQLTCVVCSK